jgi:hypothetical protein
VKQETLYHCFTHLGAFSRKSKSQFTWGAKKRVAK